MGARGVHVGERFLSLAMAACLEAHRDCRVGGSQDSPPERDLWLSRRALSLFDRIPGTGVTPTSATYALAMKVGALLVHLKVRGWVLQLVPAEMVCCRQVLHSTQTPCQRGTVVWQYLFAAFGLGHPLAAP